MTGFSPDFFEAYSVKVKTRGDKAFSIFHMAFGYKIKVKNRGRTVLHVCEKRSDQDFSHSHHISASRVGKRAPVGAAFSEAQSLQVVSLVTFAVTFGQIMSTKAISEHLFSVWHL